MMMIGRMTMTKKVAVVIAYTVSVILIAWFVLSFVDVISHNMSDCTYKAWNFFEVMTKVVQH